MTTMRIRTYLILFLLIPILILPACKTQESTVEKGGGPLEVVTKPVEFTFKSLTGFFPQTYCREDAELASHFKDVNNFNTKSETDFVGGKWKVGADKEGDASTYFSPDDAFRTHGASLVIDYFIPKGSFVYFETDLNSLDISQAKSLSFWLKADPALINSTRVEIEDNTGRAADVWLKKFAAEAPSERHWREVCVSCRAFRGVDFNSLRRLKIIFEGRDKEFSGNLFLDNISFFGDENVFFLSLKDNLKGFPKPEPFTEKQCALLLELDDRKLLERIAHDSWEYLANVVDRRTNLPLDHVFLGEKISIGDYTSPTNIGLYLASCIAARDLGFIRSREMESRISDTLDTLEELPNWKGFLHNYYNTTNLQVTGPYISTVDNGWYAVGLQCVINCLPRKISQRARALLDKMDFYEFYDEGVGQLAIGVDPEKEELSPNHYGLIASEARITSFLAIAKGDIEPAHWFMIYRTLPRQWKWQRQVPKGSMREYYGVDIFEGYYEYEGRKIVPSWGGSAFEFLMPTLFIREAEVGRRALGLNDRIACEIQRDYAKTKGYPVWGISPCSTMTGTQPRYIETGIPAVAAKGYTDKRVITPHASFLALEFIPEDAIENIRELIGRYNIYGDYGLFDSVSLKQEEVCPQYLCLDQAMTFLALANYLKGGVVRKKFRRSESVRSAEKLLKVEEFFG